MNFHLFTTENALNSRKIMSSELSNNEGMTEFNGLRRIHKKKEKGEETMRILQFTSKTYKQQHKSLADLACSIVPMVSI